MIFYKSGMRARAIVRLFALLPFLTGCHWVCNVVPPEEKARLESMKQEDAELDKRLRAAGLVDDANNNK
jgi:hypothetical protein